MCVSNLPKVATQWNSGATRESNPGPRIRIPSALTTEPLSQQSNTLEAIRNLKPLAENNAGTPPGEYLNQSINLANLIQLP